MSRPKGSKNKKTLEKLDKVEETPVVTIPEISIPENLVKFPEAAEVPDAPKRRGRKPGSKNKKTIQDETDKQSFTAEETPKNTTETYYNSAVRDKEKLEKMLTKETEPLTLSFIHSSLACVNLNIEWFKNKLGVVTDEKINTGKYVVEEE